MKTHTNLSDMAIPGWDAKYDEILRGISIQQRKRLRISQDLKFCFNRVKYRKENF